MNIQVNEKEGKVFTLYPEGNIDYITAAELDEAVVKTAQQADKMEIDLSKINYIASAGLRVLLNADDLMKSKNGLILTNVNDYVMGILKMTGFLNVLKIGE